MDTSVPSEIIRTRFAYADLESVQQFDCGDEPYEREVANWIRGKEGAEIDSALTSINHPDHPGRVWLYKLTTGTIVGFGSLGYSEWRWKGKKDPKVPVTLIIWVGLQREFQGKPEGAVRDHKYSTIILNDLIKEAEKDRETHPVIGLLVHKDNVRAIKLYERFGFAQGFEPIRNKATKEIEYIRMAVVFDDEAVLRLRDLANKK